MPILAASRAPSATPSRWLRLGSQPQQEREAQRLVERLPENASWDDLMYEVYVRQAVERGIADADAGRVVSHDEAMSRLGLKK